MSRRRSRLALLATIAVLAAPADPTAAGQRPARQPGPLWNLAAPFNQPPGPGAVVTAARTFDVATVRAPRHGSLINEAAPFNAPSGDR